MTEKDFDQRAVGLLADYLGVSPTSRDRDNRELLTPEVANWIDTGGFCCCQNESECPTLDYDERTATLFGNFETRGPIQ